MRIEKTGDYLVIKDNQNEIKHFTPYSRMYVHLHPIEDDYILLSDRAKNSVKDAIPVKVSDVEKVGAQNVYSPSRGILLIFLSILLDPTKSILETLNYLDGYRLDQNPSVNYYIETEELFEEPRHFFNAYADSNATFHLTDLPENNVSFRITNGSSWNVFLKDSNGNSTIKLDGSTGIQQPIKGGYTVNVSFDIDTGIYTITDL